MYNAVGADIIRPREADSLPYEFYRWVGAFNNEDKKDRGQKDRGTGLRPRPPVLSFRQDREPSPVLGETRISFRQDREPSPVLFRRL